MSFGPILSGLALVHPAIRGLVFCDEEGEQVEALIQDPNLDAYDLAVAGASFATLVPVMVRQGDRARLRVHTESGYVWMQMLTAGYYLVVLADHTATDGLMAPHLASAAEAIVMQM